MLIFIAFKEGRNQFFTSTLKIEAEDTLFDLSINLADAAFMGIPLLFKHIGSALNEAIRDNKMIILT